MHKQEYNSIKTESQGKMLKEERQHLILEMLRKNGKVLAAELSQLLEVSEDTIRRDLRELDEAGKMVRVHGGGLPHSPAIISFTERLNQSPAAKVAIARAAVNYIHNGQTIILDGGTTNLHVAHSLPVDLIATIITNSPVIADTLSDHPTVEVILLGGRVYKKSRVTVGISTVEALKAVRADLCFLGICSLHPDVGISTDYYEEAYVKAAMVNVSTDVLALAAVEKLGTASPYVVAPIMSLTHLITELEASEELILPYREAGIHVELV
jgi:DeoR/GlpR family transcriptional regulator of sugar metabolism